MADEPQPGTPRINPVWIVIGAVVLGLVFLMVAVEPPQSTQRHEISYSRFKSLLDQGRVLAVTLHGQRIEGQLTRPAPMGPQGQEGTRFVTRVAAGTYEQLVPVMEQHGVEIRVAEGGDEAPWWTLLLGLLPWILLIAIWFWVFRSLSRGMGGGGGGLGGRGELSKFLSQTTKKAEVPDITFGDVAGQDNAKREVTELVEYLKHPGHFERLGAEVPRGVLLMGPPGTGKTLLARALAGESGVPFYTISASEFIEVFVGVGASRVRKLFEEAKKNAPAIVFIDELDSVGRTRGTGLGGGHDEREQTLNQILAEMDGFAPHEAVIVLAATNRPDVLDPALLRPGRFDRHVTLDLPDKTDRLAILQVHTRKVPLAEDVDLETIASGTPGFSGADLKNLVNEAAMVAAREKQKRVSMSDFDEARDKIIMGTERTLAFQPEERHRLAVHEAGHTVVAYYLPHADPLYKVSIMPRGRALGGTQQLPEIERHTLPEEYLYDRLAVILGGRTAEKELLGSVSSGADDDIKQATNLARAMVTRWGMSPEIGPVDLRESESHPFLGREMAQPRRFSESSAEAVDKAVRGLIEAAEDKARQAIRDHRDALEQLVAGLEAEETLQRQQIDGYLGGETGPATSASPQAAAENRG